MSITGISFDDLPTTCVGKLMYFSASYWHQLLMMFDSDVYEYLRPPHARQRVSETARLDVCDGRVAPTQPASAQKSTRRLSRAPPTPSTHL